MNDRRSCPYSPNYREIKCDTMLLPLPADAAVTMAYVPVQTDLTVYDDLKALEEGTLFPVLNKPFVGTGCCR